MSNLIAPLRIDFAGGWIDLPEFSQIFPGYVVNVAVKPYVQLTDRGVNFEPYKPRGGVSSSTGAIVLEALKLISDHSLNSRVYATPAEFAESIFRWENSMINFKIGRQDQYAIVLGGINSLRFGRDRFHLSDFEIEAHISERDDNVNQLEKKLLLVHSGVQREAQNIVEVVRRNISSGKEKYLSALMDIAQCGTRAAHAVNTGNFYELSGIMSDNWDAQKRFSPEATSSEIDTLYETMLSNGASGGKLCGAGGGGYFVFYCTDREKVIRKANELNLQVIVPEFEMRDVLTLNNLNP
jgi:D-glycero-alpha-D-manno-heptose-7-phosphate kinase